MCNTDPCSMPGEHWIAIYVDDDGHHGEYFDSTTWTLRERTLPRKLQSITSRFCTHYCASVLILYTILIEILDSSWHHDACSVMFTVSQKNVPPLVCYNLDIHCSITIIIGRLITEKVGNQLYFPTSPTCASALPRETGNPKIASFHLNAACFLPKTHETH